MDRCTSICTSLEYPTGQLAKYLFCSMLVKLNVHMERKPHLKRVIEINILSKMEEKIHLYIILFFFLQNKT